MQVKLCLHCKGNICQLDGVHPKKDTICHLDGADHKWDFTIYMVNWILAGFLPAKSLPACVPGAPVWGPMQANQKNRDFISIYVYDNTRQTKQELYGAFPRFANVLMVHSQCFKFHSFKIFKSTLFKLFNPFSKKSEAYF